jgi:hypothetical protein
MRCWITRSLLTLSVMLAGGGVMTLSAQTPTVPSDNVEWRQSGVGADLAQYSWTLSIDGGAKQAITSPACTLAADGDYVCQTPVPAMTPGVHAITMTAIRTIGGTATESAASPPLSVTFFVVVPPHGVRIVKG